MAIDDTTAPLLEGYDPFDPDYLRDPYPMLERARREQPVFYYPPLNFWVITRYDDVATILGDSATYSNRVWRFVPRPDQFADRLPANLMAKSFVNLDPPEHTVSRKNANKAFTKKRVAQMETTIEEVCHELIDRFADRGRCDLMQEFCYPMSLTVITRMLGLPEEDMPLFRQWTEDVFSLMTPAAPGDESTTKPIGEAEVLERYERIAAANAYYTAVVEDRRVNPRDDLTTAMVQATDDEGRPAMSTEHVVIHMIEITAAGNDTTANLIANLVEFLDEEPEQRDELKADPSLLENAVEEGLRRRGTSPSMFRLTTRDVELSGVPVPAGSVLCLQFGSASHDEEHFPDPRRFDLHRPNADDHWAFSRGRHFCMGAPLARLEARVALRVLYERLPGLRVAPGDQDQVFLPVITLDSRLHLQVVWD